MSKNFEQIIDTVKNMSVIELSDLVKALEETFGVSAAAMAAPAAVGGGEAAEAPVAKSEFKVVLKEMGADKIKVIKALRQVTTLGLAEAKTLVESAPATITEAAPKEEAQKIKETLEAAGAKVELV